LSIILFGIGIFLLLLSMRTMRDVTFNLERLSRETEGESVEAATGRVVGNLMQYIRVIRAVNNHKAKLIFFGTGFFFIGVISMIFGIVCSLLMV